MSIHSLSDPKPAEIKLEVYDGIGDISFKQEGQGVEYEENTVEEKKLVRKIDLFLLPCIWIVYLLSYMDRSNLGNARVAGMADDLGLTDRRYYLCVVIFQVGYVIAEVPCNMILSRSRPSIFIPIIMVFWGAVCAVMGSARTWQQLIGLRFLLGVAEAGFSPAVMFIVSSWYRKSEQSKRFMVFHSAGITSGAVGSILAGAITSGMDGLSGIQGWRWLYIIEGIITVVVAFVVPFVLLDYPLTSKKLSPEERQLAYNRLVADGITSRNDEEFSISHFQALKLAFSNWRLYPLMCGYMIIIGNMTLSNFYPTFVMYLGYNRKDAQYMTAPLYGVALAIAIALCVIVDKMPRYRPIFTMAVLLICGTLFCGLSTGITAPVPRYIFLCFINTAIWAGNPLSLSYTSTVLGPVQPEVRAISLASINGMANLAQLYATEVFTVSKPPLAILGFGVFAGLFAVGAVIYLAAFFVYQRYPYKPAKAA